MGKRESAWQIDPFRRYFVCVQGYGQGSYVLAMCSHLFISAAHKTHQRQLTLTQAISEPAQERAPALHSLCISLLAWFSGWRVLVEVRTPTTLIIWLWLAYIVGKVAIFESLLNAVPRLIWLAGCLCVRVYLGSRHRRSCPAGKYCPGMGKLLNMKLNMRREWGCGWGETCVKSKPQKKIPVCILTAAAAPQRLDRVRLHAREQPGLASWT